MLTLQVYQCIKSIMETFYHGTFRLFNKFNLAHVLEGDGKVKFGYGVYVTSKFTTAAHYAGANPEASAHYVYTVEIPEQKEDNFIAFKQPVHPAILQRTEAKLGEPIPEKFTQDGKDFRKYLAKKLKGTLDLASEKAASEFLDSIGVDFIVWPYNWKNPSLGTNRAVLNDQKVRIIRIDQVELDSKKKLVPGSETNVPLP